MQTEGQTDRHEAFCNFAKAPKDDVSIYITYLCEFTVP